MAASGGVAAPAEPETELWQLHRTYILAPVRGALVIIDQHAAHERILYEQARARLEGRAGVAQQLLFPTLIDLTGWNTWVVGIAVLSLLIGVGVYFIGQPTARSTEAEVVAIATAGATAEVADQVTE